MSGHIGFVVAVTVLFSAVKECVVTCFAGCPRWTNSQPYRQIKCRVYLSKEGNQELLRQTAGFLPEPVGRSEKGDGPSPVVALDLTVIEML